MVADVDFGTFNIHIKSSLHMMYDFTLSILDAVCKLTRNTYW